MSPSAKRAWIEIYPRRFSRIRSSVALCEEGVDRNDQLSCRAAASIVALCEEGVDRNFFPSNYPPPEGGRPLRRGRG